MTTPQRWWCPQCNASYTSPLPLEHPPAHFCRPPTGRSGIRNFELTPAETTR